MKKALSVLRKKVYKMSEEMGHVSRAIYNERLSKVWVILPVGEGGFYLYGVTGSDLDEKTISSGEDLTVLERTILMYKHAGIKDFLILLCEEADLVNSILDDGRKLGVNIHYSSSSNCLVGGNASIIHALNSKKLPDDVYAIYHNPVEQIIDYSSFVQDLLSQHYYSEETGALATVVVSKESPYSFSGMCIVKKLVQKIEMYPMIPLPAYVGITVFSPEVYKYFDKLFTLDEDIEFEERLFPVLIKEEKLFAIGIDYKQWISIRTNKHLELLRAKIKTGSIGDSQKNKIQIGYYSLFTDGGSKGNPGPAAIGGVIYDPVLNTVNTFKGYIGETTNNQAEYQALQKGLELALDLKIKNIHINMDSELVVKQILGEYQVKNEELKVIYKSILGLLKKFSNFEIRHIRREFNKVADALVNEAIKDERNR